MRVIGIGETVLDILFKDDQPQKAVPGGSTFNSIISLGRAGVPCAMVTEAGGDHIGDITCRYLEENGVSAEFVCRHEGMKSHVSLAFLDEHNDAQYIFYKDHASVSMDGPLPRISADDAILFGSFFAINPVIRPVVGGLLHAAREAGAWIYYDVNFRKNHPADPDTVAKNIALSDIVRASDEDIEALWGDSEPARVYRERIAPHCPNFICTKGARPAEVFSPGVRAEFPTTPVEKVLSTIGAGDNFNAGIACGILREGFTRERVRRLTAEDWALLVPVAMRFSAAVCASLQNYVNPDFQL
jgi:fructokinase